MRACALAGCAGGLPKAIRIAATAHLCGLETAVDCQEPYCKHPHQHRRSNQTLKDFSEKILKDREQLEKAGDFSEITAVVQKAAGSTPGIGTLAVYDTSLRLACALGGETMSEKYFPQRVAIEAFAAGPKNGLDNFMKKTSFSRDELLTFFDNAGLVPAEVENLLCVCKNAMN
jgi:hypothetical protein